MILGKKVQAANDSTVEAIDAAQIPKSNTTEALREKSRQDDIAFQVPRQSVVAFSRLLEGPSAHRRVVARRKRQDALHSAKKDLTRVGAERPSLRGPLNGTAETGKSLTARCKMKGNISIT